MTKAQRDGLARLYFSADACSPEDFQNVIFEVIKLDTIPDAYFWEVSKKIRNVHPLIFLLASFKIEYNPIMMRLIDVFNKIPADKKLHREKGIREGNEVLGKIFGDKGKDKKSG